MTNERRPARGFRPGEYVRDELIERRWTVAMLAELSGLDTWTLTRLIHDDHEPITEEIAAGLSRAFGTSAALWRNLERMYAAWVDQ